MRVKYIYRSAMIILRQLEHDLIDITPTPVFTWLEGLNNWMVGCMKMLGGMFVLRRITAANMATNKALT
jgi:hypothetical protein